jgi:SAM-dependent methyltransferase
MTSHQPSSNKTLAEPLEDAVTDSTVPRTFENYDRAYREAWHWEYTRLVPRAREWHKLRRHVVQRVGLRKGSRVLEVACGQGYHVDALRRMGFDVMGVDLSAGAIEFAQRVFPDSSFRHLDAAARMPFDDASFDLVCRTGRGFFTTTFSVPGRRPSFASTFAWFARAEVTSS